EFAELPHLSRKRFGFRLFLPALEKLRVKYFHHRATRSARADDHFRVAETAHLAARDLPRFIPVARVERWLAAAGLGLGKINAVPEPFEDSNDRHAHLRVEGVDVAWDEQSDAHGER